MASLLQRLQGRYKAQADHKARLRAKAILLDVNGTLFDVQAAAPAFKALGLDTGLVELWFSRVLRDGWGAQAAGVFASFKDVGASHLDALLRAAGADGRLTGVEAISKVVAAWAAAPLYPDIPPALSKLNSGGVKVSVLTNGSADAVAKPVLAAGGALQLVKGHVLDINMVQAWKPFKASYSFAVSKLGLPADKVCMVASHPWDVAGAMAAGLRGVYVRRNPHEAWPDYLPAPDGVVDDFAGLVELLGL